ncbi:hypothetical protein BO94DRAFT_538113 [Aspergillus sclerotioniger CBS 115572]|uniref:Zinc finger C2H2 LYAR-type domain-containing protein n=1 Tax=Aspergillus sclerotioniger CBS 115572 TaxID=1450535 RepID=A0A317VV62_9EURO|nr:hypothetical protein BO94DRAFT_538113 [Aspergillus sclerotioniger CBS 115572]PWY77251.1 hypothetical protein BO94DRAFT_538113 [Aspergillus sclerotioniger CBS 115572]
MVSFSCEACGDVLTKKKLDPHRNQCRGASYTCIDCMVHFYGTEYRSHTSCMSEAQKYQGALYREKPAKNQRKQQNNGRQNQNQNQHQHQKQNGHGHRAPYVEDANDTDNPPAAPTPPVAGADKTPAQKGDKQVNVFDYLVAENTPNASKVSLGGSKEQMKMVDNAPSVFETSKSLTRTETDAEEDNKTYDVAYEENGFSYGAGPINKSVYEGKAPNASEEFMTPAPKKKKDRSAKAGATTSEKKRKRRTEDHDMEGADTPMMDAPSSVVNNPGTPMLHSGLTGGLDRMLRSPSLDGEGREDHPRRRYQDPSSPIKRTRRDAKDSNGDAGLGISMKNRAERLVSSMFGGSSVSGSSVNSREPSAKAARTSRRGSDDGETEARHSKKLAKVRNVSNGQAGSDASKSKRKSSAQTDGDRPSRRVKQIEYSESRQGNDGGEVVVYQQSTVPDGLQRQMATHFLSLVSKGPESTRGFSVNKVLKRFHRDFTDEFDDDRGRDQGRGRADRERRMDDEKELWRTLRVKQNERGEVVLFF